MSDKIQEIAERLRGLREALDLTPEAMAETLGVTPDEYLAHEQGQRDFSFTFLYNAANVLRVNIEDLLTGQSPTLRTYSLVRRGRGLKIERRQGFRYQNLAYHFRGRVAEPFLVEADWDEAAYDAPLVMSTHPGQEYDLILSGSLRVSIDGHEFVLDEGDSVYYDSSKPHGMVAAGPEGCRFLAVVLGQK